MYNPKLATEAQSTYCKEQGYPNFSPYLGGCWACGRNIYQPMTQPGGYITGITVEGASAHLITGCPHCGRSYCD